MAETEHVWDGVATDLVSWLETESKYYANAIRGGSSRSPFAAQISEREKLDTYRRMMFMHDPDGTIRYDQPNNEGRKNLMETVGPDWYGEIFRQAKQQVGRRSPVEPEPDEYAPDEEPI